MNSGSGIGTTLAAWCFLVLGGAMSRAEAPNAEAGRKAVEKGLQFLQKDAAKWRQEKKCANCHHGVMTVWAFSEAKATGFAVAPEVVAENVKWTKNTLEKIDQPRDSRPGFSMLSTPALFLSAMALGASNQDALSADELKRIGAHLVRHQEKDGSWAWSSAPAQNRPPPVFESDEVATLIAYSALEPGEKAEPKEKTEIRESRQWAAAWLAKTKPSDTTQGALLQLLVKSRSGESAESMRKPIEAVMARQNKDGGWSQVKESPSDAFATGQALYVLRQVGVEKDRAELQRGVAFLVKKQKEDGSWPMASRAQPGATPFKNPV
ncbi:MAG TPA: prenyltransferase/squalene oxidase repeat-containing protein, partial [Planctomycetia bacterium]|nr:prenyltransferase/squalene oxidase repeat-containing protein [Planctomycetia bacterium]